MTNEEGSAREIIRVRSERREERESEGIEGRGKEVSE